MQLITATEAQQSYHNVYAREARENWVVVSPVEDGLWEVDMIDKVREMNISILTMFQNMGHSCQYGDWMISLILEQNINILADILMGYVWLLILRL